MLEHNYPKGSEWRRWDLHIHTPGTKKNDQFEIKSDSIENRWIKFIADINSYSGEIAAIGITDYVSLDNYFEFKKHANDHTLTKVIPLILPNIELRILPVTGSSIALNIHCLFNPEFDAKIQERFLNKLKFDNGDRKFTASKADLIELGRTFKNNQTLPEQASISEAIGQFIVSIGDLKDLFKEDPELKNNTLIIVANSSTDGASGLKDHYELIEGVKYTSLDATRQTIYKFCDGIFSGNDKDAKYFAGLGVDSVEEVERKCLTLKPCFHGCDAHDNNKIFEPDLKRYCWLKTDPTFNGLRQTLYEPVTRVRIQEDLPEQKKDYLVIDSVKFIGDINNKIFSPEPIELNDKLNAIIGGKSSGKSLLLYYIAKTIDPVQIEKKFTELEINSEYDFDDDSNFDFEVTWKDGIIYKLKQQATEKNRQITYIPQMYINFLAEKRGKDGLKKLIQSFLEEKEAFSIFLKEIQKNKDETKILLTTAISQFFQHKESHKKTNDEIKSKGDKTARLQNIEDKNAQLASLRSIAGFTEEDESNFELLENNTKIHKGRLNALQQLLSTFQSEYPNELQKILTSVENSLESYSKLSEAKFNNQSFISKSLSILYNSDKIEISTLFKSLIDKSLANGKKVEQLIFLTNEKIASYESRLLPFLAKIQNREKLQSLQKAILEEQEVVDQINELERFQKVIETSITDEYDKIIANYTKLLSYYNKIVEEINGKPEYSEISAEKKIKLKAFVDFETERFNATCTSFINKQSYFSGIFGDYFDATNNYVFNNEKHSENFKDLLDKILNSGQNNIRFNQGGSVQNVTRSLLDDYFSVNYELSQDNEDILKMSPGKKGLILLFLILHLSNADYPILIDQPEDNLDNRTVYTELKDFIKKKKIERQIVIVTHNANLVVPTDAENVIAANQEGQDAGKDNENYRFEYLSGAIENSFRNLSAKGILKQMGIKEHVCEVLEGGEAAFLEREKRYSLTES